MKLKYAIATAFLFFIQIFYVVQAQQIKPRDKKEIRARALSTVNEFEGLLNLISSTDMFATEIEQAISISYNNEISKLFTDASAVIEDDLDPQQIVSEGAKNISIKTYLHDFDLMYEKSGHESVKFSEIKVSKVQEKEYVYVQVYFVRKLGNQSQRYKEPFQEAERLAEVKAIRDEGGKWKTEIASIVFFDEESTFEMPEEVGENTQPLEANANLTGQDNPVLENGAVEPNTNFYEVYDEDLPVYEQVIANADKAFEEERYAEAMEGYLDARSIKPYYSYPIKMFTKAKELSKEQSRSSITEKYQLLLQEAERAEKRRDYQVAKTAYTEALNLGSDNPTVRERLFSIDKKLRLKAEIESKYVIGNYKEALKDFQKASKNEPQNPEYYLGIGKCYFAMRDASEPLEKSKEVKKALKNYDKAIELDYNFLEALATRARLYADMGEFAKAVADYTGMLSNEPENSQHYLVRALTKIKMNDTQGALSDFASAIQFDSRNHEAYYERGSYQYQNQSFENAKINFDSAISISPRFTMAFYQRGRTAMRLENYSLAMSDFEKARELGLDNAKVEEIQSESDILFQKGMSAKNDGNAEEALQYFTYAVDIYPENYQAWYNRGVLQRDKTELRKAIKDFERAYAVKNDYLAAYQECGNAYFTLSEYEKAFAMFKEAYNVGMTSLAKIQDNKSSAYEEYKGANLLSLIRMGDCKSELSNFSESYRYFKMALEITDKSSIVLNKAGYAAYKLQRYNDALDHLKDALKENENLAEAYYHRGLVHIATQEFDEAIEDCKSALEKGLRTPDVYYALGLSYGKEEEFLESYNQYNEALSLQPEFADAYWGKAVVAMTLEQFQDAVNALHKFEKYHKGKLSADYYYRLGFSMMNLNDDEVAEEFFREALTLESQHPYATLRLGCILYKKGEMADAFNYLKVAFKSGEFSKKFVKKDERLVSIIKDKVFKQLVKDYL